MKVDRGRVHREIQGMVIFIIIIIRTSIILRLLRILMMQDSFLPILWAHWSSIIAILTMMMRLDWC